MSKAVNDPQYIGHVLLQRGFKDFTRYMFKVIEGNTFHLEQMHDDLFAEFEAIYNGDITRSNINLCPRVGKTTLAKYFLSFCLAKNPKCNFIYTSYSQSLLGDISRGLVDILEHPVYKAMFSMEFAVEDIEEDPVSQYWREYLHSNEKKASYSSKKIVTPAGGVLLFSSVGASITGYGASVKNAKGFTGALLCFPYDEVISTSKGMFKIGDIVENRMDLDVHSYNHDTKKVELKPISRFIKNETKHKQKFVKVALTNGESFVCTDDHKVFTKNRGYIEARLLTSVDEVLPLSDSLDLIDSKPCLLNNLRTAVVSVSDKVKRFTRKLFSDSFCVVYVASKPFERFSRFYGLNSTCPAVVYLRNLLKTTFVPSYAFNIFHGKFAPRENKSTKFNSILHIFGFSSVCKVLKSVVGRVGIKVSDLYSFLLFANKSPENKLVHANSFGFSIFSKIYELVTISVIGVKKLLFKGYFSPSVARACVYFSLVANNISLIRNRVKSLVFRNVFVDSVVFSHYDNTSYCLTVADNHNLVVGNCKVLASNCDDANKPADIHSEKKRKNVHTYYDETLLSRLNNSDTPVINIQQRLHVDDLTGYLNKTYKFKTLAKPLLVDGVCQLPKQYTQERIEELQQNQYMFNAQYQQEPYKLGGDIFKDEYWNYYDVLPQMQYYKIYADTATKTKEYNDFSVLQLWGKSKDGKCYLIDQLRGKWEAYDLEVQTIAFWNKHKPLGVRALCIEDASSGTGLIQNIRRKNNIPVEAISRQKERKDKLTRAMDTVPHIVSGNVFIPSQATWLSEYVAEFSAFTADDSHAHDDQIDPTMDAISDMLIKERKVQSVERRLF